MYYFGIMLNTACLYMVAGTGAAICNKSGEFNLGGEGQIYFGGFIAAIVIQGLSPLASILVLPLAFLSAALAGAILTLLSSLLKKYRSASYLLTSYIISAAVIPLTEGLITGPCRQTTGNLLATPFILQKYRFAQLLPPSPFNAFFIVAVLFCVLGGLFLYKTTFGKNICIYGVAPEFSRYSGLNETTLSFTASCSSGALHGITGAAAVCGTYYACHAGFYAGMGWNALAAAMIAGNNPFLIIPSSLLLSSIMTYAGKFALYHNYDFDIGGLIQAVILFVIAIPFVRRQRNA